MKIIIRYVLITLFFFSLLFLLNCSNQSTSNTKTILIRCDDIGMCHAVNIAAQRLIDQEIPFSASVMVCCPWFLEAVDILKDQSKVSVGVHLTLNAEWKNYRWGPITGPKTVPSLIDENGYFFSTPGMFSENEPQAEEVEIELRAQIDRAINSGLDIDYLDYHMGTAVSKGEFVEIVEKLAAEYKLGISRWFGEVDMNGVYSIPIENKTDTLMAEIPTLDSEQTNLLVCHIGTATPEMNSLIDMNKTGLENMSQHRAKEADVLCSSELKNLVDNKSVKLITYKQLIRKVGLKNMVRPESFEY